MLISREYYWDPPAHGCLLQEDDLPLVLILSQVLCTSARQSFRVEPSVETFVLVCSQRNAYDSALL